MGQSVGLPPLVVIIALLIGAETMGLLGMFLAVPVASVIRVITNHYIKTLSKPAASKTETQSSESEEPKVTKETES